MIRNNVSILQRDVVASHKVHRNYYGSRFSGQDVEVIAVVARSIHLTNSPPLGAVDQHLYRAIRKMHQIHFCTVCGVDQET